MNLWLAQNVVLQEGLYSILLGGSNVNTNVQWLATAGRTKTRFSLVSDKLHLHCRADSNWNCCNSIQYFLVHSVVCTTAVLQTAIWCFFFQFPVSSLLLVPHLLVTSILPSVFPSIMRFKGQFLHKLWPIQLAFLLLLYVGYSSP